MKISIKNFVIASIILFMAGVISACDNGNNQAQIVTPTLSSSSGSSQSAANQNDTRDIDLSAHDRWPQIEQGATDAGIAPDMLAKNYYVILDASASMSNSECSGNTSKIEAARTALKEFANAVPLGANLGLMDFRDSNPIERVPLMPNNQKAFIDYVDTAYATGGTPLETAISRGFEKIETQARMQLGYGEYHLVIVTDGEADILEDPTKVVNYILANTPVIIHTIGFCIDERHSLNQPGRTDYQTADNPRELIEGLQSVLAEAESFDVTEFDK